MKVGMLLIALFCAAVQATAQDTAKKCFVLCQPELKIEPTVTWENLFRKARTSGINDEGKLIVEETKRERVFETVVAADIPSTIPRIGFTFETIFKPLVKGTSPEIETELNLHWLRPEDTKEWIGSHFDIVDKYSPGGRPSNADRYSHKLNFELDTGVRFLKWTKKPWISDIEIEGSLDYVATGLPRAGDHFGNTTYLDNASAWSFSLVFVLPLAPVR